MPKTELFKHHRPFLIVLLLHLILALAYTVVVPLGEAPDEPAHLTYAQFIADKGGLPTTLAERREAGYRSTWPPLYHTLIAIPVAVIGDALPTRLKAVGDTPRRLIPTNGQTIASFIHTEDEAWPWRGVTLAWHLGRLISVALMMLAVIITYLISWQLTNNRTIATSAAALHGFLPQLLFIGTVINDDNLLILLSSLTFLIMVIYTKTSTFPSVLQFLFLGMLLGLATVAKYNALPLWGIIFVWLIWLILKRKDAPLWGVRGATRDTQPSFISTLKNRGKRGGENLVQFSDTRLRLTTIGHLGLRTLALPVGAALTSGWWFVFVWLNFNQISTQGNIAGSFAALGAGTSDASLRQISTGSGVSFPLPTVWLDWFSTLFQSFWGLFGGGGTIAFPTWAYLLLTFIALPTLITLAISLILNRPSPIPPTNQPTTNTLTIQPPNKPTNHLTNHPSNKPSIHLTNQLTPSTLQTFFFLTPLFYLPLPILRFILSGSIVETAQGRHLFPAISLIAPAFIFGLLKLTNYIGRVSLARKSSSTIPSHIILFIFCAFIFVLSLYGLNRIRTSYPSLIPLRTTEPSPIAQQVNATLAEGIELIGYEIDTLTNGTLPITLLWQAESVPPEDYLIELTVTNADGLPIGGWLGQPIGGRYPTRAWDEGDILRDHIPLPLLPNLADTQATLTITLLDTTKQPTSPPISLTSDIFISQTPNRPIAAQNLRADNLPPAAPFTYRSTLSFVLPEHPTPPQLHTPDGQSYSHDKLITGPTGSLAHFIVAPHWPSNSYQLSTVNYQLSINNRPRQFTPPALDILLDANFDNHITLLGYDLPQRRVDPGHSFPITLHLRAERTMGQHLAIFNHLLDADLVQRGGVDRIPQNFYTTLLWVPGEIVSDAYDVPVDADAPPGIYWLDLGLYPTDNPTASLPLIVDGQPIDRTSVMLGPIKVGGPPPGLTTATPQPQAPLNIPFADQITLLGYDIITATNQPTNQLTNSTNSLTLYWQPTTLPLADYTVFVHFINPNGELVAQADSPPAAGAYPTSLWDPGETIIDIRPLPHLPPGQYTLNLGLYNPLTGERLAVPNSPDGTVTLMQGVGNRE